MKNSRNALTIAAVAVCLAVPLAAQKPDPAQTALKAAIDKEMVDGDLKGAIALYEKTVAEARGDRATAAKALIRMAECHQKLGNAESRKLFERVLREYADQKDAAATARARLGNASSAVHARGDRVVWAGKEVAHDGASISPDGRLLSYTDWFYTGDLMLHDLASGANRQLTGIPGSKNWSTEGNSNGSAFSWDGKQLAYGWLSYSSTSHPKRSEVRIVNLDGTGIPQPRRVLANEEIAHLAVSDWSSDQKSIAVVAERKDRSVQIAVVGARDGALRVLKSVSWRGPTKLFFSPDNKYLAYDLPASDTALQRDVFIIAVDGSQDTPVLVNTANEVVMGWSPDGRHLLFASDRTGAVGLWALSVANGKAATAPKLLKPDIGKASPLGLTASGALHFFKNTSTKSLQVAPIDLATGMLLAVPVVQAYDSRGYAWSPDGKFLANVSRSDKVNILSIRSEETGQVRQLPQSVTYMSAPHWSPDSRWLLAGARDLKGALPGS
jgi:Tol biopolymer transport system component